MLETIKDQDFGQLADFDNRARREALAAHRRSAETLPIIDFSAYAQGGALAERKEVARALRQACTNTGFFYLAHHGISEAEFNLVHAWGHVFFEQPRAEKEKVHKLKHPARIGWMPAGGLRLDENPDKEFDQKETFNVTRDYLPGEEPGSSTMVGNGLWPDPKVMPGFRELIAAHIGKRIAIGQNLCRALALSLDLAEDALDEPHRFPRCSLTYNYYPPLDPDKVGRTQWGISPHTDYGSFTLLWQDDLGGLEIRNRNDEWIDVPPIPGTFVVNIADLMARWTNGVYRSSLHRASNFNTGKRARISVPMFFNPHPKTMIECLPTCQGPGNPAKYEAVEAGPYMKLLLEQSYRTGRPGVMNQTAEERMKTL